MTDLIKNLISILPVVFPILAGFLYAGMSRRGQHKHTFNKAVVIVLFVLETILTVVYVLYGNETTVLFKFTDDIRLVLRKDTLAVLYSLLVSFVFLPAGIFGTDYMRHDDVKEEEEQKVKTLSGKMFFGIYFIVWGVLIGLSEAGNLVTFYMFYELMTLSSVILVIHDMTREAIYAAKKYLFYSIGGAAMALFGFAFMYNAAGGSLEFVAGGSLDTSYVQANAGIILLSAFLLIIGFGTKAGIVPMHGWLTSAHPVAPAPASAVLSGIIAKAGVLGIIRVIFFITGPDCIRDTWVQYAFVILALITVFMGSMLAYKEDILKKRLAYSTVSQVSYILFGIACLNPITLIGALLHIVFHAVIKVTLFLNAGTIIYATGKNRVSELRGIGKAMPVTMLTFTTAALGLIGIPPVCGFVSKWYLCIGALDLENELIGYVGVAVLLLSALLTAGYLLSITIAGFFPGEDYEGFPDNLENSKTVKPGMIIMMVILAIASILLGVLANVLYEPLMKFVLTLF